MEEIEKLKVIGAKEISKKTHMALNKIEAILEMAYGNLEDKATTIGLIQILEREYHLDLHQWCQEYEKFWEEHKSNSEKMEANINFKISHETMQENDNKKSIIIVAIVIVLVALGIYLYFNFHNLQDTITEKETISTPKPESALENLQEEGIIKEEAKSIHEKYVSVPETTDFAVMFLPIEGLYAEVVRDVELMDTLQNQYKIVVCGPTTLTALLNSLQLGFKTLYIEKRSSELWQVLSTFKQEFEKFVQLLLKTQNKLGEANSTIELATKSSKKIAKKLGDVSQFVGIDYDEDSDSEPESLPNAE